MAYALIVDRPLPENAQRDIENLIDHIGPLLEVLMERSAGKPDFSPIREFTSIAGQLGLPFNEVSSWFSTLENLIDMRAAGVPKSSEITARLHARLSAPRAEKLKAKEHEFVRVLDAYAADHPIHISMKAQKLSYLHEHLYQDGEIITDVRPIFDGDGTTVREMVITHSFVLNSFSYGEGGRRTHFALDATDLLRLRDTCERAIRKATALKDALGGRQWTVKVLNETDNAD